MLVRAGVLCCLFFFFNDTATTEIYTLSLHDALPISGYPLQDGALAYRGPAGADAQPHGEESLRRERRRARGGAGRHGLRPRPRQGLGIPLLPRYGGRPGHPPGPAFASKRRGLDEVSMPWFGDGGSSKGDVHEGMNFAGVHRLPVVFVCENNQYAISVHVSKQMAVEKVSVRAQGYGFPGVTVDGNDVLAVYG